MNNNNSVENYEENKRTLKNHPNLLVKFIASTNHCTKLVCTTCAGLLGFSADLKEFTRKHNLDLETLLLEIDINNILAQNEWEAYYDMVIRTLETSESRIKVLNYWNKDQGKNEDLSNFITKMLKNEWIVGKTKSDLTN